MSHSQYIFAPGLGTKKKYSIYEKYGAGFISAQNRANKIADSQQVLAEQGIQGAHYKPPGESFVGTTYNGFSHYDSGTAPEDYYYLKFPKPNAINLQKPEEYDPYKRQYITETYKRFNEPKEQLTQIKTFAKKGEFPTIIEEKNEKGKRGPPKLLPNSSNDRKKVVVLKKKIEKKGAYIRTKKDIALEKNAVIKHY